MNKPKYILLEFITEYRLDYLLHVRKMRPNSIKSYSTVLGKFCLYLRDEKHLKLEDLTPDDITPTVLYGYLKFLSMRKLSAASCNQVIAIVHSLFKFIVTKDSLYTKAANLIHRTEFAKTTRPVPPSFTEDEIALLLEQPDTHNDMGYRHAMILCMLYYTGGRATEVTSLRVKDIIGLKTKLVTVMIKDGKGAKSRFVPLAENVSIILNKYIEYFNLKPDDILLPNRVKGKLTTSGLQSIIDKYVDMAREKMPNGFKFEHYSCHSFRHSRASHLWVQGVGMLQIKSLLGHASSATTELYTHVPSKDLRHAIDEATPDYGIAETSESDAERKKRMEKENSVADKWLAEILNKTKK